MRPVLFEANATNFDSNGIGVLYDALLCHVTEEYNGAFDLELEYPADGEWFDFIKEERIVLAKPNDADDPHAFRLYEVKKDLEEGVLYARGNSITNDLGGNLIPHLLVEDHTAQMALTAIKGSLIEPTTFDFVSDIDVRSTSEWTRINPLQAIVGTSGSLVDIWGGEVKRTNNTIYLYSRRGKDKVTVIRPGKNIDGFNMVASNKGVITKILPFYTYTPEELPEYEMVEDYDGNMVKQQKYSDSDYTRPEPVTVLGTVVTSANADKYAVNRYYPVDYSQDEAITELVDVFIELKRLEAELSETIIDNSGFPEELRQFILDLLNEEAGGYFIYRNPGCDEPNVEIKADMIQLSDSPEWELYKNLETIQLTDTVDVYVKRFNVDVEVKINAITYDSIGERVIDITAGSARNNLADTITKPYEDKIADLENYVNGMENGVYNSINRTADGQKRRFSGYTEPPASVSSEGDIWYKEIGSGKVELYTYKGGVWRPVISAAVSEAISKSIENAQDAAETADNKAQGVIDDIQSVLESNGVTTLEDLIASKISDGEFGTLFFQQSKAIGLVYTKDGVDEAIIMIDGGVPYIKGEHIILNGDTIVDGTFTVTDTMLAEDAVIKHLTATGIDAKDVRIINLDASSITGGDINVTDRFRILNNGVPVFEVDAHTGQVKITAPNLATKDDLEDVANGGKNLIIRYNERLNERINVDTRTWETYQNYSLMNGFLQVKPGDKLIFTKTTVVDIPGGGTFDMCIIDPDDNILGTKTISENLHFWTVPDNAYGLWLSYPTDSKVKVERGTVKTDWTPAPEDIQGQIDSKAETSDMDNLATIVSSVSAQVNAKAGMGEFEALQNAYNARVEQDIKDKNKLTSDLATIEGRTALVETIAGNSKIVTEFINTVITESEEGIFIANGSSSTGILISDKRISFIDNNTEVAYISNQTMQINHGIFVQSATISDFKFEKIPGTQILAVTWVGV